MLGQPGQPDVSQSALIFSARRRSIGLTALIDVVFILLMFFMLTSSFNRWQAVDFHPLVAEKPVTENRNLLVFLSRDGAIQLQGQDHRLDDYRQLGAQQAGWFGAEQVVIVVPDADVQVQDIVSTLDSIRQLGVASVNYGGAQSVPDLAE